jgi:hypothetical protein
VGSLDPAGAHHHAGNIPGTKVLHVRTPRNASQPSGTPQLIFQCLLCHATKEMVRGCRARQKRSSPAECNRRARVVDRFAERSLEITTCPLD